MNGINIFSGAGGLASALTNPTALAKRKGCLRNDYPVRIGDTTYIDAESAYQTHKRKAGHRLTLLERVVMLTDVMTCKLKQHPRLVKCITERGGVAWLEQCSHWVGTFDRTWQGNGRKSLFIRCLIAAYSRSIT